MEIWNNFFVAMAGAAATLTGLLFVGVSIGLAKILSIASLPGRAFESLMLLLTILIVSALCIVPDQPVGAIGGEVLGISLIVWAITIRIDYRMVRATEDTLRFYAWINVFITQSSVLPYIIGGIVMLCHGSSGVYWLVPAILFSFTKVVIDAWVLLVEINR